MPVTRSARPPVAALVCIVTALASVAPRAAETPVFACPRTATPPRDGFKPPEGWQATWSGPPVKPFENAMELSGPLDRWPLGYMMDWDLTPGMRAQDSPLWVLCRYKDTALRLVHGIPPFVHRCEGGGNARSLLRCYRN